MATPHRFNHQKPLVFISAAEPSGDLHGASLIHATRAVCPTVRFVGVAGPKMTAAGCEPIFDMTRHSAMLLGVIKAMGSALAMLKTSDRHLRRYPFDAAVVIDSPTLHLPLAARAHALGIPVLYYIAPQLWAWGSYRIHKLRNHVDRVAVVLPFEEKYLRDQGVNASYVGHPLVEQRAGSVADEAVIHQIRNRGHPLVALLPGSRQHVVREVFPGQLEVAEQIATTFPRAAFGVSVANPQVAPLIEAALASSPVPVTPYPAPHAALIQAADLVLAASGTTTLEVALYRRPMIVMYNASRLFYHLIGRWLVHTPHLCLPNILAGRQIVPEFMPYYTSTQPIAEQAIELLRSDDARQAMVDDLEKMVETLGDGQASQQTAAMLLDMIEPAHR